MSAELTKADYESLIEQIYNMITDCGDHRTEMSDCLDTIQDLCDPDTEIEQDSDGTWVVSDTSDETDPDDEDN